MCRKLVVTNEIFLGARPICYEAYSLPKGEVVELTEKQNIYHGKQWNEYQATDSHKDIKSKIENKNNMQNMETYSQEIVQGNKRCKSP